MTIPVDVGRCYRHYKGGLYLLVAVAETHEHNGDLDAVYVSLTHGKFVTRPLHRDSRHQDSWTDVVDWPDGTRRARFVPHSDCPDWAWVPK
jgi:hypothetical protein